MGLMEKKEGEMNVVTDTLAWLQRNRSRLPQEEIDRLKHILGVPEKQQLENTSDRIHLFVEMDVTLPQAIALYAMFEHWNYLGSAGMSREVAFYVDGDGNFHPRCRISSGHLIPVTETFRKLAVVRDEGGNRLYDYDDIAWELFVAREEVKRR